MHIRAFIWNNCANDKLSTHSEYCWCVSHYDHFMICGARRADVAGELVEYNM